MPKSKLTPQEKINYENIKSMLRVPPQPTSKQLIIQDKKDRKRNRKRIEDYVKTLKFETATPVETDDMYHISDEYVGGWDEYLQRDL